MDSLRIHAVITTYILIADEGLRLNQALGYTIGLAVAAGFFVAYIFVLKKQK